MTIDSGSGLIARYEELRGQLASPVGLRSLGYALFTRQGMAAWARTWRSYSPEPPSAVPPAATHNPIPLELHTQVAIVLADIIFNLQKQEVCPC